MAECRRLLSRRQAGIAYIGLMLLVAVTAIVAGAAADVWVETRKRQREEELLWVGDQFRSAIRSYFEASPGPNKSYPRKLQELLQDNRYPGVRRHLRQIYRDPMTGKDDWETIPGPDGGIAGVRSSSLAQPLKQSGFRPRDESFEQRNTYAEWVFSAIPVAPPGAPQAGPSGAVAPPALPVPQPGSGGR